MNLRTLSNNEFLCYASNEIDELTSSEIERELLRRMEALDTDAFEALQETELSADDLHQLGEALESFDVSEVVELLGFLLEHNIDAKPLKAMLQELDNAGITEADELKEALELGTKFQSLANDAGDVFTRLTTLVTETQE